MQERRPATELPDEERPAAEDLGGESEHSMHEAHIDERASTRKRRRAGRDEEIDVSPEDMGRHALGSATEAEETADDCVEPLRGPLV